MKLTLAEDKAVREFVKNGPSYTAVRPGLNPPKTHKGVPIVKVSSKVISNLIAKGLLLPNKKSFLAPTQKAKNFVKSNP